MIKKIFLKPTKKWVSRKVNSILISIDKEKSSILEKFAIKSNLFVNFLPYLPESSSYIISKNKDKTELCEQGLSIPPKKLWLGYGKNANEYLNWGKTQFNDMVNIVKDSGTKMSSFKKILEFGCSAGRLIRWLYPYSKNAEIWGIDISSEHIYWANKYLKPHFNFATTTTIPHLPFEDRTFDFIYAGSVFTHIDDLTDAWLLELKRILSVSGLLYITIHDKHTIDILDSKEVWKESQISILLKESNELKENIDDFGMFVTLRGPDSQVFYDIDYFCESVKHIFEVVSITPEAYGYQTGVLLKRK